MSGSLTILSTTSGAGSLTSSSTSLLHGPDMCVASLYMDALDGAFCFSNLLLSRSELGRVEDVRGLVLL